MANYVCNGAIIKCAMAVPPGICSLMVLPDKRILSQGQPVASIMDFKPLLNIPTFGVCSITLMPCMPALVTPWMPPKVNVLHSNQPALMSNCMLACSLGGIITIMFPGQVKTIGS